MYHLVYLWYVLVHKYWVFVFGRKLGVPVWRLVTHDLSKFSRAEWGPYARWFYSKAPNNRSWYAIWKEGEGLNLPYELEPYTTARTLKRAFEHAWAHHWRNNLHHWEGWGGNAMPETYVREMVADWWGAGYAKGQRDVLDWYVANSPRMNLHNNTRILTSNLIAVYQADL